MTISTRITLGISAAAVSLGLALAPVAVALDAMKKDDGMKKESMSKDTMSKDAMKKDTMSKDTMKKDDGMKKGRHVEISVGAIVSTRLARKRVGRNGSRAYDLHSKRPFPR
jgi:pentapeptide MXKDX repeat protein